MNKVSILLFTVIIWITGSSVKAQKEITEYTSDNGSIFLHTGDTVEFLEGSLGGSFVHVFFMVGKIHKRKATFSKDYYTELLIDHFVQRREKGEMKTYAVMKIPNKPKWHIWALLDEAIIGKETKIKSK